MGRRESETEDLAETKVSAEEQKEVKDEVVRILKKKNAKRGDLTGDVSLDSQFTKPAMISSVQNDRTLVHNASHVTFEPGDEARTFLLNGDGSPFGLDAVKAQPDLFVGVALLTLSSFQAAAPRPHAPGSGGHGCGG